MKKKSGTVSLKDLIKRNKEELLRDKAEIEKIEKRIDEKHIALR
ncbi:FbpB family small basic protein [Ferdinandcohnia quinoae]|nr:FbpB family small basic protein [Fredinandcohnia sp. SECRCQ15]